MKISSHTYKRFRHGQTVVFCLLLVLNSVAAFSQNIVEVGGIYTENQLWTPENEYHVVQNITIENTAELRIEPGTVVKFNQGRQLIIDGGKIIAEGNTGDSIYFMANRDAGETWNWNGISILSSALPGGVAIQYACIQHALQAIQGISSRYMLIQNNHIVDNRNKGISLFNCSNNSIANNTIEHNNIGIEIYALGAGNQSSDNQVTENKLSNEVYNVFIQHNNQGFCYNNLIEENIIRNAFYGIYLLSSGEPGLFRTAKINRNIIFSNGAAADGHGIYVSMEHTEISNNIIWQNTIGVELIETQNCIFNNNSIYQNLHGLLIGNFSSGVALEQNTFSGNLNQVLQFEESENQSITLNNIFENEKDSAIIINLTAYDIDLSTNYLGTTDVDIVEKALYDQSDDPTLGKFNYLPLPDKAFTDAPVSPPSNFFAQQTEKGLKLSWKRNPESDLRGYRIFFGEFKDYTFYNSSQVLEDTSIVVGFLNLSDTIAITALDSLWNAQNDQLSGHESPFAFAAAIPYSGPDTSICLTSAFFKISSSTIPPGFENIVWTTSGDGTYDDPEAQNPEYFPGINDQSVGSVVLTLSAENAGRHFSDAFLLEISPSPIANAGSDAIISTDSVFYTTEASAFGFETLTWSTSGNGTFSEPENLLTTYFPGSADTNGEFVELYLEASNSSCGTVIDTLKLGIRKTYFAAGKVWAAGAPAASQPVLAFNIAEPGGNRSAQITFSDADGQFIFKQLFDGEYVFFVPADTNGQNQKLPAYYAEKNYWQDAFVVRLNGNTHDIDIRLNNNAPDLPEGPGQISGKFSISGITDDNLEVYCQPWFGDDGKALCQDGLSNVSIYLYGESMEKLYAHTLTDAEGKFWFKHLPFGNFVLRAELAGYEAAPSAMLSISPENESIQNIELFIQPDQKISVDVPRKLLTSVSDPFVFPQPALSSFTVISDEIENDEIWNAKFFTGPGKLVLESQIRSRDGSAIFDVHHLPAGFYMVIMQNNDKTLKIKIFKK